MTRKRPGSNEHVELPQVNPGNVKKALQMLWMAKPTQALSADWLGDQGISQPNQTWSLLDFLGLLDDSNRPSQTVIECRGSRTKFIGHISASVIHAYGKKGFGSPESLAWFGRDTLGKEEFKERVRDKGQFRNKDLKNGGHRNAFYCLRALHQTLVDSQWLRDPTAPAAEQRSESSELDRESSENDDSAVRQEDTQLTQLIEERLSDPDAILKLLRGLLDDRPAGEDAERHDCIRVPVGSDDNGKTVWARVYFEGPDRPRYLARLARLLQLMADEAMQR